MFSWKRRKNSSIPSLATTPHIVCLLRQLILLLTHWAQPTVAWRELPCLPAHHNAEAGKRERGFFFFFTQILLPFPFLVSGHTRKRERHLLKHCCDMVRWKKVHSEPLYRENSITLHKGPVLYVEVVIWLNEKHLCFS